MSSSRAPSARSAATYALVALAVLSHGARAKADEVDVCVDAAERSLTLRSNHELLAARAALVACAAPACPSEIRETCDQRLAKLTQMIPGIVFAARDGSGKDLSAVRVTIDGAFAADRLAGTPFVLDPGDHEFTFEAAGLPPLVRHFVLLEGEQERREEIVLGAPRPDAAPAVPRARPIPKQHVLAMISAGVGVAGIAAGAISGELAISRVAASKQNCPFDGTMDRCNQTGVTDMSQAKTFALVSDVTFGIGALGLIGGVVLWVTSPREEPRTARSAAGFSDPASWSWSVAPTSHGSMGFLGHAF